MTRKQLIPYFAGLFDGEGSFSIQINIKNYKENRLYVNINPRMTMSLLDGKEVLEELQRIFGGQIYKYNDGMWRWNLSRKQLILNATEELLPYLKIKQNIAERFIEGVRSIPCHRTTEGKKYTDRRLSEETAIKIATIALTLNPVSARRTKDLLQTKLKRIHEVYQS